MPKIQWLSDSYSLDILAARMFLSAQAMCPSCRFNSEDNASPLYFTEAAEKSHFFGSLSKKVRKSLQEKPFAMENHSNGTTLHLITATCARIQWYLCWPSSLYHLCMLLMILVFSLLLFLSAFVTSLPMSLLVIAAAVLAAASVRKASRQADANLSCPLLL